MVFPCLPRLSVRLCNSSCLIERRDVSKKLFRILLYLFLFYNELLGIFNEVSPKKIGKKLIAYVQSPPYIVDPCLRHACSVSPTHIREEVDLLVTDLSQRCKQSFFSAFTVAYFSVYVPYSFSPVSSETV